MCWCRTPRHPPRPAAAPRPSASVPTVRSSGPTGSSPAPTSTAPAVPRRGAHGSPARSTRAEWCGRPIPAGILPAVPRPALGNFSHEAAAVDPVGKRVYLTEDQGDACFYRFTPDNYPNLASGLLEVAVVAPDQLGHLARGARPEPDHPGQDHAHAGAGGDEVRRRRGPLVPRGDHLLHDQGRQEGLGLRHALADRSTSSTTTRSRPTRH